MHQSGLNTCGTLHADQASHAPDNWPSVEPKRADTIKAAGAQERAGRIRKGRPSAGYTVVQNTLINHPSLSIEARGLMIYLLSRPEDWELQIADVRRFLGRDGKPCGRDKSYAVVRELKDTRYIVMCEDIEGSHFRGVTYYIFDEPVSDIDEVQWRHRYGGDPTGDIPRKPLPEKPEADASPLPCFPDTENQHDTNNRYKQNTESPLPPVRRKTRRKRALEKQDVASIGEPHPLIAEPWSCEWTEYRWRRLQRGREQLAAKPSTFVQRIIDGGGEAGERERLAHQARTCWPTVTRMDEAAGQDARGWRVPTELFRENLQEQYRSVPIASDAFSEWRSQHAALGWPPFPCPRNAQNVWLPASWLETRRMSNHQSEALDAVA